MAARKTYQLWGELDEKKLREMVLQGYSYKSIGVHLGHSHMAVQKKARQMGINRFALTGLRQNQIKSGIE